MRTRFLLAIALLIGLEVLAERTLVDGAPQVFAER